MMITTTAPDIAKSVVRKWFNVFQKTSIQIPVGFPEMFFLPHHIQSEK